jgi:LmbE family N-acetylglucosaminyl deacetylase
MKTALILAAHTDDDILGVGGTIQYLKDKDYKIVVCRITDGSSTQYDKNPELQEQREKEYLEAIRILNIDEIVKLGFPDMKLDSVPHFLLNRKLSEVVENIKPNVIFTHNKNDLNKDHQLIHDSTLVISRPLNKYLKKVFSFEILSSSEWNFENPFIPTHFIDISKYLDKKIKAFFSMKTELREYPHPRSPEGIKVLAQYRGMQSGYKYAEAFKIIRSL